MVKDEVKAFHVVLAVIVSVLILVVIYQSYLIAYDLLISIVSIYLKSTYTQGIAIIVICISLISLILRKSPIQSMRVVLKKFR